MTSSTSHSNTRIARFPRRLALALGVAIGAWILAAAYTLLWNPEIALFNHAARVKVAWSRQLDRQFTNKFVIFGGSSSTFSVDAGHALRAHQFPIANLALGAGLGAKVLTRFALPELRPGDTLLMMIEPGLFYSDLDATQLGIQLSIAIGEPQYASPSGQLIADRKLPIQSYFAALRPGGYHFFTLLGKVVRGQPLYRYRPADFDESGHQTTGAKAPLVTPRGRIALSSGAKEWLQQLKEWCQKEHIELIYALPWAYCPPNQVPAFQKENAFFARQIQEYMPVLREPSLGAYSVAEHFADTAFHLNQKGAAIRTDQLVTTLRSKQFWSAEELPKD